MIVAERVRYALFCAWADAEGLDPTEKSEDSVAWGAFSAGWRLRSQRRDPRLRELLDRIRALPGGRQ